MEKNACLRLAYEGVTRRFPGGRIAPLLLLPVAFQTEPCTLWRRRMLLCTHMNALLCHLLVRSGRFARTELRTRWTMIWALFPHQYLQVRLTEGWVSVAPWGRWYGIPFGRQAHGRNAGSWLRSRLPRWPEPGCPA